MEESEPEKLPNTGLLPGVCDVCERQTHIGVASLPFAPMSVAMCYDCLKAGAYPLWAICIWLDMTGLDDGPWLVCLRSWKDGAYIDWPAIRDYYLSLTEVS